jgi:hypothetical protein
LKSGKEFAINGIKGREAGGRPGTTYNAIFR